MLLKFVNYKLENQYTNGKICRYLIPASFDLKVDKYCSAI